MQDAIPLGWLYLPVAFVLGALHALEPGHGKSLASAYLVSGEHDWKDAVVLGVATTFSHTAVVVLLALGSLALERFVPKGVLEHGVTLAGACILVAMGAWVALRSFMDLKHGHSHDSHGHDHGHGHGHGHGHCAHEGGKTASYWDIALLGIGNGVLPCPGALAALLVAISLGRAGLGVATVLTYSLGLASALALMGIIVVEAGRRARSWLPSDGAMLWLPLLSGVLVMGTGLWLIVERSGVL
jgi:ABC-type nickel/cobalt efflux system permease component RcnA